MFTENLRRVRQASGYTGSQLARMAGIKDSTYRNYESGERAMPLRLQEAVADALGVELADLYADDCQTDNLLVCAFRINSLSEKDSREITAFKRVVKSYLKMERLLQR